MELMCYNPHICSEVSFQVFLIFGHMFKGGVGFAEEVKLGDYVCLLLIFITANDHKSITCMGVCVAGRGIY